MNDLVCRHCGKENIKDAVFCMFCGNPLEKKPVQREQKRNLCPNCFRELEESNTACPHCGYDSAQDAKLYPGALPSGTLLHQCYILGKVLTCDAYQTAYLAQNSESEALWEIVEFFPQALADRGDQGELIPHRGVQAETYWDGERAFFEEGSKLALLGPLPALQRVLLCFEENDTAYIVREHLQQERKTLKEYTESQDVTLSMEEAERLLFPIIKSLGTAHAAGLLHLNINPEHILMDADGTAQLIGFGGAQYQLAAQLRRLNDVLSPGFSAPEQYSRRRKCGDFTDVYGMAAVLYYIVTGRPPQQSIDRAENDTLADPPSLGAKLTAEQEDAILKGLAVKPEERWQLMAAFRAGLEGSAGDDDPAASGEDEPAEPAETFFRMPFDLSRVRTALGNGIAWGRQHKKYLISGLFGIIVLIAVLEALPSNRQSEILEAEQTPSALEAAESYQTVESPEKNTAPITAASPVTPKPAVTPKPISTPKRNADKSSTGYTDVPSGAWYEKAMLKLESYTPGIIFFQTDEFHPDWAINRAEFLKMVMTAAAGFTTDRSRSDYFAGDAYTIALENNILLPDAFTGAIPIFPYDSDFLEQPINRYEAAVILANTCSNMLMEPSAITTDAESHITDYAAVQAYTSDVSRIARGSYTWAVEQTVIKGIIKLRDDGSFVGEGTLSRADSVVLVYRLLNWEGSRAMLSQDIGDRTPVLVEKQSRLLQ